jgi:hypothetical protein
MLKSKKAINDELEKKLQSNVRGIKLSSVYKFLLPTYGLRYQKGTVKF